MPKIIENIKFYTIPEAAESLQVSTNTIRNWIKEGKLRSQRIGRPYLITEKNLREFLKPSLQ